MRSHSPILRLLCGLLFAPALAACGGATAAAERVNDAPAQHVLLISLDTLRADHTGFGGYRKPTTPFLDSLAARGVVFEDHNANSNCTLPSHASMLTGLLPPSHGVRISKAIGEPLHVLDESVVTLAERFQDAGYRTAAFTAHAVWLNELYGFDQGFDYFSSGWRLADETIDSYLELIDSEPEGPSFTFLHFFDIHSDSGGDEGALAYRAAPEFVDEFAGPAPAGYTGKSADGSKSASVWLSTLTGVDPLPAEFNAYLEGQYDAGIAELDHKLARLFAELERRGQLAETLIVITSDHGEAFGEHRTYLHDGYHAEVSHVPLVIVPPARFGVAPHRVAARTQSTDLAPTLLDLARLERIGETRSLAGAVLYGEALEDSQGLFLSRVLIGSDAEGDFRLLRQPRRPKFFDTTRDPAEQIDFAQDAAYRADNEARMRAALAQLDSILDRSRKRFALIAASARPTGALDAEQEAELRDLGYL